MSIEGGLGGGQRPVRGARVPLRAQGFAYDSARRRVSRSGHGQVRFPYRYLGADDQAGPNYTGQPAVDSFYEPLP